MASQSQINAFVSQYSAYAQQAAAATGLNAQLILAQWGNETAWGTEFAEKNNIGNVGVYGGGPNPSYATPQAGVQAYINEINSPAMAKVKATAGQSIAVQAAALGSSGYAGGDYLAEGSTQPGSALLADANVVAQGGYGTQVSDALPASDTSSSSSSNPANATNSTLASSSTDIGGVSYTGTQQQTSALSTIEANLATYGFTPAQTSQLTSWAWGEITNNVDPTQIAIDLQAQPAFQEAYPGFAGANASLQAQGLPAVSVQQYQQYQTQAQAMAQAAGLPSGFISSQNIGTLIGGNVSTSELSSRINNAVTLAYQSTPEQQQMFNQYFGSTYGDSGQGGLTTGQIASLALDPKVAEPLIAQQITTAQIGGAAVTSGVGALSAATATQLAQAGVTTSAATSAFQNLAPYSALETARPGMGGEAAQGTVSADQLATGQLLGDPAAQRQLQQAVETAKSPFSGGGGFVQNAKGTVGAGSASSSGAGNT
jgi:hypothetical protein